MMGSQLCRIIIWVTWATILFDVQEQLQLINCSGHDPVAICGKIHWAKHSWFQTHEIFMGILSGHLGQKCLIIIQYCIFKYRCLYFALITMCILVRNCMILYMCKIHWAKHAQFQTHKVFTGIFSQHFGQKCLIQRGDFILVLIAVCILVDACVAFKIWGRITILQRINKIDDSYTVANCNKGKGDCRPCAS